MYDFKKNGDSSMKIIMLLAIFITLGFILATGCVGQIKKDNGSVNTSISPAYTFSPIVNNTTVSNATIKSGLNGTLKVSISSWNAELPLFIDSTSVGTVAMDKPFMGMVEEGNHTVKVCAGTKCVEEEVEIKFAKQVFIDFSERLKKEVVFPVPTAQIIDYYRSGDGVGIVVEFINPSVKDLVMSADISDGYTYIYTRTNQRTAETVRGRASATVKSGQRQTTVLTLSFASDGYSYLFDAPVIGKITTN